MWLCLFFWCRILCVCMWFDASQYLNFFHPSNFPSLSWIPQKTYAQNLCMFKFVCWLKMIETSDQYFWRFLLLRLQGLPSRNHFTICWLFPEPVTLKWAKNWCKSAILGWNPDMFTWKLHKQKCVSCLFVAEVWVLQKHMQRDSYTLSHDQWIQCDLAVKIWEFWRLRGPARKWITWRSNWRCSAERSFHWLLFWMHHVLTIPGRLFSWFSWHQFFFQTKYDVGVCIFSYATILNLKDFDTPIESWLMVYQMWGQGSWRRNLDPNWMVKSFFQWSRARLRVSMNWLNCYHQKMVIKMGSLSKRDTRWGYIYIYTHKLHNKYI